MSDDDDIAGPLVTERKQVRQQYLDGKAYPPYKQPGSQQPGHRKPRDDEFVVCGQGGAHSYVDGTAKTWPNGGPAGNGLFYWPRNKLSELCCMLVKTRWHMDVRVNGRFNFVADFDDKDGKFADYLDAGVMQRTMEAALRKFLAGTVVGLTVSLDCIRLYTHCMCLLCRQCSQEVQSCVELGSLYGLYGLYAFFQIILRDHLRLPNDPSESAK